MGSLTMSFALPEPMRAYIDETDPLVIERAEGSRLFDVDGRSYLDATSSWWVASLGHSHPRLVRALTEQASPGPK